MDMRTASLSLVQDQGEELLMESSEMQEKEEVKHTEVPIPWEPEFDSSEKKKSVDELEMMEDAKESFSLEPPISLEPPSLVQRRSITLRLSIVDVVALDLDLATILSARLQQSSASRRNSLVDSGVGIPAETKAALPTPQDASKPMSVIGVDAAMTLFNRFRKEASAVCSGVSSVLGSKREVLGTKGNTEREHGGSGPTDGEDSIFEMVQSTLRRFTITSQSQAGVDMTPSKDTKGHRVRRKELLQPLRKTLKRISVFPTIKHTMFKTCPSDRSLAETCACAPSTPFLLMTQMDMGGIHRPGRRDADTESYMVISEDNAVLDVLPMSMNPSDETVAPTGANAGALCRRKSLVKASCAVRTFLTFGGGKTGMSTTTSDRSSFSEDEDAGSSDDTDTDTDRDVPSIQTVSPVRRGRDPPFPIRPIIPRRLSGTVPATSVVVPAPSSARYTYTYMPPIYPVAEEELEESDTDSMSVYSDDISVCD